MVVSRPTEALLSSYADVSPTRASIAEAHARVHRRGDSHARPRYRGHRGHVRGRLRRTARATTIRTSGASRERRPADARAATHPAATRDFLHVSAPYTSPDRHRLLSHR